MKKIRSYRRYSPEEKSKHLDAWHMSGKSMVDYALSQNLNLYTFRLWVANAKTRGKLDSAKAARDMRVRIQAKSQELQKRLPSTPIPYVTEQIADFSFKSGFKEGFELGYSLGRNSDQN